jgi:CubicO group peptidase (beta-lactamase class C family)
MKHSDRSPRGTVKRRSFRTHPSLITRAMCSAFFMLCLIVSPTGRAQQKTQNAGAPDFSRVETLIRDQIASGTPSIAIAVAQHGKIIWEEAIGMANREGPVPATTRTPYYLASVSKTITATALMELVDGGKISLDKPVNDYLGSVELRSPMWDASEATILRMATHTAGLTTYDRSCKQDSQDCSTDTNDLIRRYGVIVWQPGDHFDYSNADYGILGQVVAHTSAQSLPEFLQQHLFMPLGMKDCFLDSNTPRMQKAAVRYDSSHPNVPMLRERSTTPGASSMYCSVHDLALFGMFHLKNHLTSQRQILADHSIDKMQKSLVPAGDGSQYGLGWWIQENLHGYRGVLAQGGTHDATAYLQLVPSEDIAVAMLWNSGTPNGGKVIDEILSAMLPHHRDISTHPSPTPVAVSSMQNNQQNRFIGRWSGSIQTYKGNLPLVLSINPSGDGSIKLGSESDFHIAHFQFDGEMVKCDIPGPHGLGDTGPDPYRIDIKLYLHDASLVGAARTRTYPPSIDDTLLFYGSD